jgi:hypothetical protein
MQQVEELTAYDVIPVMELPCGGTPAEVVSQHGGSKGILDDSGGGTEHEHDETTVIVDYEK